jgi:hypothetical protein
MYVEASSTFGQTRIYLPRSFNGPLDIWSWARTPRLSAGLRRACTPVSQEDSTTRWFVGKCDAWSAKYGCGDHAKVESSFGAIWIGYIGEEDEGARALRPTGVHWALNAAGFLFLLWAIFWIPRFLWRLLCTLWGLL